MVGPGFRCGFVAVIGRPNVGKSTLINQLMGEKVSIVTPKPQTTRHRILAILSAEDYQAVFIDTPGLHRHARRAMNRLMNRAAVSALGEAELVLFVSDVSRWTDEDEDVLKRLDTVTAPVIAVLNKIDKVEPRERLLESLSSMSERYAFAELVPVSAKRGANMSRLLDLLPGYLPESPPLFPGEMVTDRSEAFRAAETIREKLTLSLSQEIPYGLTVQVESYHRDKKGVAIGAVIWVERDSQKGIVVGKGGRLLKKIGREARLELKQQLGLPVHLELWVREKHNWADNEKDLQSLGYDAQ